jgi:hypothetical protein
MFRLTTTALIAASLLGLFVAHGIARGRSFPIEVTGTIRMFDRANHIFTFQSDKPARVLTIAVGRDCQFFRNSAPAGEWILKKGARVRVSYFSTIFTGNIAVKIESNPVRQRVTKRERPTKEANFNSLDHTAYNNRFLFTGREWPGCSVARRIEQGITAT